MENWIMDKYRFATEIKVQHFVLKLKFKDIFYLIFTSFKVLVSVSVTGG